MKNISIVIMAAGDSTRFLQGAKAGKIGVKKQWIRINDKPLWLFVAQKMLDIFSQITLKNIKLDSIIITASKHDFTFMHKYAPTKLSVCDKNDTFLHYDLNIVEGGKTRFESSINAVKFAKSEFLLISDCARFNVDFNVMQDLLLNLDKNLALDCIVPVLKIKDSVLQIKSNAKIEYINRDHLRLIQTPQIVKKETLQKATKFNIDFNDESSAINMLENTNIMLINGSQSLDKITFIDDVKNLELNNVDVYSGFGSDTHAFESGNNLKICGIDIECDVKFKAHSDGDIALHALIDAMLGAAGLGDIGELFPDNSVEFKDIDSKILLKKTNDLILSFGLEIINIDLVIIMQAPKIAKYKNTMRENLSNILYVDKHKINIKATTPEKMGALGRQEGASAQAIVNLRARKFES